MSWWLRANADRVALAAIGLGSALVGIVFHEQQLLAVVAILAGIAILVLSVLLRGIEAFDGSKRREDRLNQVGSELEGIQDTLGQAVVVESTAGADGEPIAIPGAPSVR